MDVDDLKAASVTVFFRANLTVLSRTDCGAGNRRYNAVWQLSGAGITATLPVGICLTAGHWDCSDNGIGKAGLGAFREALAARINVSSVHLIEEVNLLGLSLQGLLLHGSALAAGPAIRMFETSRTRPKLRLAG